MGNRSTRRPQGRLLRAPVMLVAAIALVAAGCGTDDGGSDGGASAEALDIVVTTSVWGDVVRSVVGDDANVTTVIPIGADAHDFTPSSQQVAEMQAADLVVTNGLGLEEGFEDVLEAIEADGGTILALAPLADPIPFRFEGHNDHDHGDEEGHEDEKAHEDEHDHDHEGEEGHDDHDHGDEDGHDHGDDEKAHEDEHDHDHEGEEGHDDHDHGDEEGHEDEKTHDDEHDHEGEEGHEDGHDHGHDHDGDDPHVWLDPDRVGLAALALAEKLTDIDDSVDWVERAEAYVDSLRQAGEDAETTLAALSESQRKLVTNHEALGYFADRFGFEVVGVVIPGGSTLADPSSAELAELVEIMEAEGVRAIFGETSSSTDLAEAVAAELGEDVIVVELFTESLGEPGSGADSVPGMIRSNAELIAEALTP